jgi:hypothetical protein
VAQSGSVQISEKGEASGGGLSAISEVRSDESDTKPKSKSPSGRAPAPAKPAPTAAAPPPPQAPPPVVQNEPAPKDEPAPAETLSEPVSGTSATAESKEEGYAYGFQDQSAQHEALRSQNPDDDRAADPCAQDPAGCQDPGTARSSKEDSSASYDQGRVEPGDRGCGCGIPKGRARSGFALAALAMLCLFVLRRRGRG